MPESEEQPHSKRHRCAYHEAGHAVVAWASGLIVRKVTIVPEGDRKGHVNLDFPPRETLPPDKVIAAALSLQTLAGPMAERRLLVGECSVGAFEAFIERLLTCVEQRLEDPTVGSVEDILDLWRCINGFELTDDKAWIRDRIRDAIVFVNAWWPAIENVAAALLEQETIDGRDFERLIDNWTISGLPELDWDA